MKRKNEHKPHPPGKKIPQGTAQVVTHNRWKPYIALAVILLVSFLAYVPVFHNGLLGWDDDAYIKNNPLIQSFHLKEIFSQYVLGNYHPFTILTLAAEYHLFGLNAAGYHTINLLLHLLNVILVFYTVLLLSDKSGIALVVALLFGIHPLHVESVAWAAELKDLLYTFFFLASYIFYLKYHKNGQNKNFIFAILLFLVALLSKAMAASLPLVLLLTDYFKGRKFNARALLEKIPFFLLAIAFGILAIWAQKSSDSIQDIALFTFPQRIVFACYGFVTYLVKLLLPLALSSYYPYPIKHGAGIPIQYYGYVIFLIVIAVCIVYSHRYSKKIVFGLGFFTATVFFVLQLLPVGDAVMADRYGYLPSVGIFYLAGEGFDLLWRKRQQVIAMVLPGVFTVFFAVTTFARCSVWESDMTLWNDVISHNQTIAVAYNNRGSLFYKTQNSEEALRDFNKAIELDPYFAPAYNNRGNLFNDQRITDKAILDYTRTIELNPAFAQAYYNRGLAYMNASRTDEALKDFGQAVRINPAYPDPYNDRGIILMDGKRYEEALRDFSRAIELNPGFVKPYINRGNLFFNEKRYEEAIRNYSIVISLKPGYAKAFYNRGLAEFFAGRKDDACNDLNQAARLGYPSANNALLQYCQ